MAHPTTNGVCDPEIKYLQMTEDRVQEVVDLMVKYFFTREPTFSVLSGLEGGSPEEHRGWLSVSAREWSWENSWLAVDERSGRVVGAAMSAVYAAGQPDPYWRLMITGSPASAVYHSFLDELEVGFDIFQVLNVSEVTENLVMAVDPSYCGRGIGTELCRLTSVEGAARSGAPVSLCYATSAFTQRIYEKLGFTVGCEGRYAGSVLEKAVDVTPILHQGGCRIMYKRMRGVPKPRT